MHTNLGAAQSCARGERPQLLPLKRGLHGDLAVVDGDRLPTEQPARIRKEIIGERTSIQIDGQYRPSRNRAEAHKQFHHLFIGEVMQE